MGEDPPKYQVEDILNKKKPPPQILDLTGLIIETDDEFKATLDKIPDYEIQEEDDVETLEQISLLETTMRNYRLRKKDLYQGKTVTKPPTALDDVNLSQNSHDRAHTNNVPEIILNMDKPGKEEKKGAKKLAQDEKSEAGRTEVSQGSRRSIKQKSESSLHTGTGQKEVVLLVKPEPYQFTDPCPPSMRHVRIADLSAVDINWKMLTLARPTTRNDEMIFSKLVQLDKLRLDTRKEEVRLLAERGGVDPQIIINKPSCNKGGVPEKLIMVCEECKDEFCSGNCIVFQYESYQRIIKGPLNEEGENTGKGTNKKKKHKSAKKL